MRNICRTAVQLFPTLARHKSLIYSVARGQYNGRHKKVFKEATDKLAPIRDELAELYKADRTLFRSVLKTGLNSTIVPVKAHIDGNTVHFTIHGEDIWVKIPSFAHNVVYVALRFIYREPYAYVVYSKQLPDIQPIGQHIAAVDCGVKNWLTIVSTNPHVPSIILRLPSLNQHLKSPSAKTYDRFLSDACYCIRRLGKFLYETHHSTLIVGTVTHKYELYTRGLFFRTLRLLRIVREYGQDVRFISEAYTSSCSCLSEDINERKSGNVVRLTRGLLYDPSLDLVVNADCNAAFNIMKLYTDFNLWQLFDYKTLMRKLCNPIVIREPVKGSDLYARLMGELV